MSVRMAGEGTFFWGVRVFGLMTLSNLETYVNGRCLVRGSYKKWTLLGEIHDFFAEKSVSGTGTLCRNETEEAEKRNLHHLCREIPKCISCQEQVDWSLSFFSAVRCVGFCAWKNVGEICTFFFLSPALV